MSNYEHGPVRPSRLNQFSGKVLSGAAELYLKSVQYNGLENIHAADEILGSGNSVLFVSDHPNTLSTTWTANVVTMLSNRQATGVLLKYAFAPESKHPLGYAIRQIIMHHNAEPLFVKTDRYEADAEERARYNQPSIDRGNEILGSPGGCLFLYAQGTRDEKMLKAKSGLANYSALAGYIVPVTTITEGKYPLVVVHQPIPGKLGIAWCVQRFGEEEGPRVFSDLIMSIIATAQPRMENRGAYLEMSRGLEEYMTTHEPGIVSDENVQKVLTAYRAWEEHGFTQI